MLRENNRLGIFLLLGLAAVVAWNYWLPMAEDFYNLVTPADENRQSPLRNVDFFAYYNAGVRFERGENPYYYRDQAQSVFSDFIYPPTLLPFYGLLSELEYDQARLIWISLYLAVYILCFITLLFSVHKEVRGLLLACGLVLTMASFPLLMHIHNGQSDVLVISMVLIGYAAYIKGFKTGSALLFALATVTKVSPILFMIYFVIFLKDYNFLAKFCLWALGIVLLSLLLVPYGLYTDYFVKILPEVGKGTSNWLNQSIVKYVPTTMGSLAQVISLAGFALFSLFAFWVRRRYPLSMYAPGTPPGEYHVVSEDLFILNILVILVFSGKAWSMVYVWMILPAALIVTRLTESSPKTWYLVMSCIAIFLLLSKVYGFPILDSLNLWGGVLMSILIMLRLINARWTYRKIPDGQMPLISK